MILLVVIITITCIALYFLNSLDDEHSLIGFLTVVVIFGLCIVPTLLIATGLDYFNALEKYFRVLVPLPLITLALLALWATWGKSVSDSNTSDKKDDLVADAIILTTVLSENNSDNSNSSSSSSKSDDSFFL